VTQRRRCGVQTAVPRISRCGEEGHSPAGGPEMSRRCAEWLGSPELLGPKEASDASA
jgi:hypothetical protein